MYDACITWLGASFTGRGVSIKGSEVHGYCVAGDWVGATATSLTAGSRSTPAVAATRSIARRRYAAVARNCSITNGQSDGSLWRNCSRSWSWAAGSALPNCRSSVMTACIFSGSGRLADACDAVLAVERGGSGVLRATGTGLRVDHPDDAQPESHKPMRTNAMVGGNRDMVFH